jgi:hypothetical protein
MAIFISYSHEDSDFVQRLAAGLIKKRHNPWLDKWELRAGDSLIQRIQDAIDKAEALLVVLSKASVESDWCKKELSVGLTRELEEKRVVVIPVVIDDCKIPAFLRDKYYADFRKSFRDGLNKVVEAVATVTSDAQGRIEDAKYYFDWSMDWFFEEDRVVLRFTIIEHHQAPFTVLTVVRAKANAAATQRYRRFAQRGFDWFAHSVVAGLLNEASASRDDLFMLLNDQFEKRFTFGLSDKSSDGGYDVEVTSRRMGQDTGKDILVNFGSQIVRISEAVIASQGKMDAAETLRLAALLSEINAG